MVSLRTKNPKLGMFCRTLEWKLLLKILVISNILQPLDIFYGHLVHFAVFWYIFSRFGRLYREKSGSPARLTLFANRYCRKNTLSHLKGPQSVLLVEWPHYLWTEFANKTVEMYKSYKTLNPGTSFEPMTSRC
jgi:hypothetical protein